MRKLASAPRRGSAEKKATTATEGREVEVIHPRELTCRMDVENDKGEDRESPQISVCA